MRPPDALPPPAPDEKTGWAVAAPLVLMAVGALLATGIGWALSAHFSNGFFDLSGLGVIVALTGYGSFAVVFPWVDLLMVRNTPGGRWASHRAIVSQLAAATMLSLMAALLVATLVVYAAPAGAVLLALLVLAAPVGWILDLRARASTRVAPSPGQPTGGW